MLNVLNSFAIPLQTPSAIARVRPKVSGMGHNNKRSIALSSTLKKSRLVPCVTEGDYKLFKASSKHGLSSYSSRVLAQLGVMVPRRSIRLGPNYLQLMAVSRGGGEKLCDAPGHT